MSFYQKIQENWCIVYSLPLITSDLILFNLAFCISFLSSREDYFTLFELTSSPYCLLLASNVFFLLAHILVGDYRDVCRLKVHQQIALTVKSCIFFSCVFLLLLISFHPITYISRLFPVLFLILLYLFSIKTRSLISSLNCTLYNKGFGKKTTLIIGTDRKALRLASVLNREWYEFGYEVKGFVSLTGKEKSFEYKGIKVVGTIHELKDCLQKTHCQYLFVTGVLFANNERFSDIVQLCLREKIPLKLVPPIFEKFIENPQIRDVIGVPIVSFKNPVMRKVKKNFSLMIYRLLSLLGLLVLFPFLVLIGIAIKLESKGPILFKQKRMLCEGGKKILVYKFRTMIEGAEELTKDISRHKKAKGAIYKNKDDNRVTRVGEFLRRFSIDELPQLINVLQGNMSLVGPRPFSELVFKSLEDTSYYSYLCKRREEAFPGITGLWQVNGRADITFDKMLFFDFYYIEHQSLSLDLEILFKTISIVITCKGAY